jgi:hypothetical protein
MENAIIMIFQVTFLLQCERRCIIASIDAASRFIVNWDFLYDKESVHTANFLSDTLTKVRPNLQFCNLV